MSGKCVFYASLHSIKIDKVINQHTTDNDSMNMVQSRVHSIMTHLKSKVKEQSLISLCAFLQ